MLANGLVTCASRLLVCLGPKGNAYTLLTSSAYIAEGGIMECCDYLLRSRDVVLKGQWVPRLQEFCQASAVNGCVGYRPTSCWKPFLSFLRSKIL